MEKEHKVIVKKEVPREEQWLFDPQNREIVAKLKRALKQEATKELDLSLFEKE